MVARNGTLRPTCLAGRAATGMRVARPLGEPERSQQGRAPGWPGHGALHLETVTASTRARRLRRCLSKGGLVSIVVRMPPPLDDGTARLVSRSHIVEGIATFDEDRAAGRGVRSAGAEEIATGPRRRRRTLSSDASTLLRIAWQTELAARVGTQFDDDALRLATLPTLPVQAYYAVFNAGRAFTRIAGAPKDTHAGLQEAFAREHVAYAPGAFRVTLLGDPQDVTTCQLSPTICEPTGFNPMEADRDAGEYIWAALRIARRHRLEAARERWLNDRRNRNGKRERYKRLPPGRPALLAQSERPTTLLDYLYDLRCSTNYRTSDEYSADVDPRDIARLHTGLLHLMDMGLLCYEGQIARYVGVDALRGAHEEWAHRVSSVGTWASEAGCHRIDALEQAMQR